MIFLPDCIWSTILSYCDISYIFSLISKQHTKVLNLSRCKVCLRSGIYFMNKVCLFCGLIFESNVIRKYRKKCIEKKIGKYKRKLQLIDCYIINKRKVSNW